MKSSTLLVSLSLLLVAMSPIVLLFAVAAEPPGPPLSVTATASGIDITLEWSPPPSSTSIDGYRIYRGETSGSITTDLGPTTDNTFTDYNLRKGDTYYYQVAAFNVDGEGVRSEVASATIPTTAPGAIDNLAATRSFGLISLTWSPPDDDGGSAVTQYSIYRSDSTTAPSSPLTTQSGTGYIDRSIESGRTYFYWVAASNVNGLGPLSNMATASPLAANLPGAPTNLNAQDGVESIQVSWSAPADNGGAEITEYRIYRATSSTKPDTPIHTNGGGTLTYSDSADLVIGTTYYYWVAAYNSAGEGEAVGPDSAVPQEPPEDPPGPPGDLQATGGAGSVSLSWTAPSPGDSMITQYNIYRATDPTMPTSPTFTTTGTSYTDSSVTNGQTYYYSVSAVSNVGEGAAAGPVTAIPGAVPGAPLNLVARADVGKVNLTWNAPSSDGGSTITEYDIYRSTSNSIPSSLSFTTTSTTFEDTSVTSGVTYYYWVTARNSVGEGSAAGPAVIGAMSTPSAPQSVNGELQNGSVFLSWAEPSSDGGAAITQYVIYRGVMESNLVQIGTATELTYNDTNTVKGNTYYYAISAINEVGEGARSAVFDIHVPLSSVPSVPLELKAEMVNGNVLLTWTVPTFNGGGEITGYKIYRGTSQATLSYITSVTTNSFEDNGRRDGVTYVYTVAAVNEAGDGPSSAPVTITVPKESVVDSPVGLVAIAGLAVVGVGSVLYLLRRNRLNP